MEGLWNEQKTWEFIEESKEDPVGGSESESGLHNIDMQDPTTSIENLYGDDEYATTTRRQINVPESEVCANYCFSLLGV